MSSYGFTVDCRKIAKKHAEDLGRKCLNDVVMASPSPTSLDMEWVTHYNLSAHVREMATTIDLLKDSHIFRTFWAEAARALLPPEEEKVRGGPLVDIEDVYDDLYLPCFNKFRKLYEDLKSGELTLGEVHTIFGVFVNKYDDLTFDLRVMCALDPRDPRDWIQERMGQVREYHHLHLSAKAAKVILEVKETLGLTGDFSLLHFVLRIRDSARDLGWLKKVKESHGSVEHSSLSLARAINSRGIYVIQVPTELQQISPDTALYLLLPESSADSQEQRRCSLEELKELLNKLMLMSGKKDHHSAEAQVFSEVFCNVQRLLQAFLNLYSAGSFLFRAWKVEVHCCPGLAKPVQMNFGLPLLEPLQGHAPLVPLLEALCRQMEHFLGQWEGFLARKRAEHFHLNYYTAEQLREHCYLPSAFSQHRVPAIPRARLEAARAYLAHHYQVPEGTQSAAAAFRDRMCVGIVASARAGVDSENNPKVMSIPEGKMERSQELKKGDGAPSQPSQPLGVGKRPGGRRGSLQGQAAEGAEASGNKSSGSSAPQDQTRGGAPPGGKDQEGASPTASARWKEGAAQKFLLPMPQGGPSEPRKDPPAIRQQTGPPASREAKTKGKTAISGGKAKPGNPKEPERGHWSNTAALKDKDQKERKADAWEVPGSPLGPGEGVRVFFHAILSKDFGFDPDQHQIVVRGGEELGKPEWNVNVCELHITKPLEQVGALIEGCAVLSKRLLDRPVPYKYVVIGNKGSVQDKESEDVNRCLHLKSSLLGSGDWHQYDDIICMKSTGIKKQVLNYVKEWVGNEVVKKKKLAASIMLDRVLSILQTWSTINLNSFFMQFRQFYSVVSEPMVYKEQAQTWTFPHYTKNQVREYLWKCLQKHMALFLEKSEDPLPTDFPVRSKLRMGLIALHVAMELKLSLSKHDLDTLCGLLCTNARSPGDLFDDLSLIFSTSQSKLRMGLIALHVAMELKLSLSKHDLDTLCGLLCTNPSSPGVLFDDLSLIFRTSQRERQTLKRLLQLMVEKKYLLSVDEDLFRSWFSLLPLSSLAAYLQEFSDYLTRFPARVLDCLLGTRYRLQGHKDVNKNLEDIDKTLKMLLHLLGTFQDKVLQEPLVPSYLTVCLKLHEAICELTKGLMTHELLASSAEIVCIVIRLKPIVDSEEGPESDTGMRTSVRRVAQGALAATRAWFRGTFKQCIFCNSNDSSVSFTYSEEIQVWRRLVEIRFPDEHGWKESLLGDLEGRLKQERPLSQISAYCSTGWATAGADDSVSKCFEKCAIEAVGLACQSQTSILEGLSQSNLQRFGILASAVVTKSWPRCNGEAVDDLAEVLKYLLTWPDVKHLFKLYRTDKKILAHITEDGKKLMAMADSVFTKVAEALLSRTVLVEQLQLIRNHMTQFLHIWELKRKSLSPQEEKYDMKKVLDSRWKELQFLQKEQSRVDSLLKLCEGVKHWVKVDCRKIAKKHAEDLGRKCLNDVVMASPSPTSLDMEWVTHYNLSAHVREMATTIDLLKDSHIFRTFWAEAARALLPPEEEEVQGGPLVDIEDVYDDLYLPCFNKFRKLYEDLKSGELTLGEVHTIFGVFVNKYDDLTFDLRVMCALDPRDPRDWIQERMGQVREYHHLHLSAKAAKVILEVKETLGLTGDFSLLHFVLRITEASENSRHKKLGQIDRQVISANEQLRDMNEARCQCLLELALAREFVHWVREAVKGINELKVFVDLAFIFAGENDMDMDRVACFHDAVQGYSSLLYKLDTSAHFHVFMGQLKELWKALENDQHLPSKL
ncbi:PREDICTED: E3 ubiquitin-protein ligase RNF213-like, partial [Myotis brandtii]|uniref:E3 ubiquitin-protein ligase RNF213-like n=2 Tax=Myotis brandtii TaxID=109478 RepID=UPI000704742E